MIENKVLFNRMAAEWIKEFMFKQKEFKTIDILKAMPLKHLGIDFDTLILNDAQRTYVFRLVEALIPIYAPMYQYAQKASGEWAQANNDTCQEIDATATDFEETESEIVDNITPENNFGMVSPFYSYVKALKALLGADPDVTVLADEKAKAINICVAGCDKPSAYRAFFPGKINIGSYKDVVILINGHKKTYKTRFSPKLLTEMFIGHPLFSRVIQTTFDDGSPNRLFCVWKNTTVQFVNDNFGSLWNATTTTPEQLAKDVLDPDDASVIWHTTESVFQEADNNGEIFG